MNVLSTFPYFWRLMQNFILYKKIIYPQPGLEKTRTRYNVMILFYSITPYIYEASESTPEINIS